MFGPASMSKKDYARGYNAGRRNVWPEHRPPQPPNDVFGEVMRCAIQLRDSVDAEIATLGEDDELSQNLAPKIDRLDEAITEITKWLSDVSEESISAGG